MLGDEWLKLTQNDLYDAFDEWIRKASEEDYWSESNPTGQRIHWQCLNEVWERYQRWKRNMSLQYRPSNDELIQQGMGLYLDMPGCYLFGWGSGYDRVVPRYVGETGRSLKKRLSEKYIRGPKANPKPWQERTCNLAEVHKDLLTGPMGWKGFSDNFLYNHFKRFKNNELSKACKVAESCKSDSERRGAVVNYLREKANPTVQLRGSEDFARRGIEQIWFALIPTNCDKGDRLYLEDNLKLAINRWNCTKGYDSLLNR